MGRADGARPVPLVMNLNPRIHRITMAFAKSESIALTETAATGERSSNGNKEQGWQENGGRKKDTNLTRYLFFLPPFSCQLTVKKYCQEKWMSFGIYRALH
ncbi:MAG: hypothetical protein ACKV2V_21555 [Blastocatellia bacterium]